MGIKEDLGRNMRQNKMESEFINPVQFLSYLQQSKLQLTCSVMLSKLPANKVISQEHAK
jgi:hypothetical protein